MALSPTLLESNYSGTNGTSFSTSSLSPNGSRSIIIAIPAKTVSGGQVDPTVSGFGVTWTKIAHESTGGSSRRCTVFMANLPASPGSDTIDIDFGSTDQDMVGWVVIELSGFANVIQWDFTDEGGESDDAQSVTLSAFSDSDNVALGFMYLGNDGLSVTPGSGFTELDELQDATFNHTLQTQYKTNDNTVDWTWSTYTGFLQRAIAIELAEAVTVTPGTLALSITGYAPTVQAPRLVTPDTLALSISAFAPSVVEGINVIPSTLTLSISTFAPDVLTPRLVTPTTLALITTGYAPTIGVSQAPTPSTLALVLTTYAPTITGFVTYAIQLLAGVAKAAMPFMGSGKLDAPLTGTAKDDKPSSGFAKRG